jgi:hypothetical protein
MIETVAECNDFNAVTSLGESGRHFRNVARRPAQIRREYASNKEQVHRQDAMSRVQTIRAGGRSSGTLSLPRDREKAKGDAIPQREVLFAAGRQEAVEVDRACFRKGAEASRFETAAQKLE